MDHSCQQMRAEPVSLEGSFTLLIHGEFQGSHACQVVGGAQGRAQHTSIVHLNSNLSSDADIYGKQQKNNESVEHRKQGVIGIYF